MESQCQREELHVQEDDDGTSHLNGCRTNNNCTLVEGAIQNEKLLSKGMHADM